MKENAHTSADLKQMQSLSLESKINMTKQRIKAWYEHFEGNVYVSFSGGKDSTVLKHIVDSMYDGVPSVFVNTGLEYPEIQKFVNEVKAGKFDCLSPNVVILRPEMRFDEVIKEYGYPVVSKAISKKLCDVKRGCPYANAYFEGTATDNYGNPSRYNCTKWKYLLNAPFLISNKCCDIMKKEPLHLYEKQTKQKPFIGTMADEGVMRAKAWMKTGCNAYDSADPKSQPLSFWTEQDVLHYIEKYNVPYCSVYGNIITTEDEMLATTGCNRTGCMFCMFGAHLEKEPNRFQTMKETHPIQYEYCLKPIDEGGLGLATVLDYIGIPYK